MKKKKNVRFKLANFKDPKWSYAQLVQYARKYREMLANMKKKPISNGKKLDIIAMEHKLYAYNSIMRSVLIERLEMVQAFLYKK